MSPLFFVTIRHIFCVKLGSGFEVSGSGSGFGVQGSGFSAAAAGQKNGRSNRKRNWQKVNIEYRIINVECRSNVFCLF
jgi:hypothetical protein